jgi:hypothetical protein
MMEQSPNEAGRREGAAPRCHIVISIVARLAGLALFVYAIHYAVSGKVGREMEIEARKKT